MANDFTHVMIVIFVITGIFVLVMIRLIYRNIRGDHSLYFHSEIPRTEKRKDLSKGTHGKLRKEWAAIDERSKDARIRGLIRDIARHHGFPERTARRLERRAGADTRRGERARNRLARRDQLVFREVNILQKRISAGEKGNRAAGHVNAKGGISPGIRREKPVRRTPRVSRKSTEDKKK